MCFCYYHGTVLSSLPFYCGVHVGQFIVFSVFGDHCFVLLSFFYCIVCPSSIYGFRLLPLWYLQTCLTVTKSICVVAPTKCEKWAQYQHSHITAQTDNVIILNIMHNIFNLRDTRIVMCTPVLLKQSRWQQILFKY